MQVTDRVPRWTSRFSVPTPIRLLISLGLLALVLSHMDVRGSLRLLGSAHLGFLVLTLALMLIEAVYRAYKWVVLVRCTLPGLRLWPVIRINFISGFAGQFMPGAVGMELIRMYGLARVTSNAALGVTSVLLDRVFGLLGLILVLLAGTWVGAGEHLDAVRGWLWTALLLTVAACALYGSRTVQQQVDALLARWSWAALLRNKLQQVSASFNNCRDRPGVLAWALVLAVGYTLLRVTVVLVAARSLGIGVGFAALAVVVPLVLFASLLPISIGGLGVREGAFVSLLALYGVPGEAALALSVLIAVMGIAVELPGAWFLAMDRRVETKPAVGQTSDRVPARVE